MKLRKIKVKTIKHAKHVSVGSLEECCSSSGYRGRVSSDMLPLQFVSDALLGALLSGNQIGGFDAGMSWEYVVKYTEEGAPYVAKRFWTDDCPEFGYDEDEDEDELEFHI